jgi:hypothetical protein
MSKLRLRGSTSGFTEIQASAVAGDNTITLPATTGGSLIAADSSGNVNIDSGTLYVDATNNRVGIGTTTFHGTSYITPIQVKASGSLAGGYSIVSANSENAGGIILASSSDNSIRIDSDPDNLRASSYIGFNVDGTERGRWDSSGRFLVGTSSSASAGDTQYAKLQVQGNSLSASGSGILGLRSGTAAASISTNNTVASVTFADNTGNEFAYIECKADGTTGSGDYPGRLVFSTTADGASSPTERMRISSTGATSFTSSDVTSMSVTRPTTTADQGIQAWFSNVGSTGSTRAYVRADGGLANYSANNQNLSDEREKKNVVELDSTWNCLKHWELKKFHYNEDPDDSELRYGVIAQQIAQHCPEVIADWIKPAKEAVLDADGNEIQPAVSEVLRKGVREQQMMWMAIRALQEAQLRIETLEAKVAALEGV